MRKRSSYWREYSQKRRLSPAYRLKQKQRYKDWWERHKNDPSQKSRVASNMRRYRNDPRLRMRHEARWQANRALKRGEIKRQPCSKCSNIKSQMHHIDYYKPLEVVWLCQKCHSKEHRKATNTTP